ncbi:hypothetical protein MKW98_011864 [Papaver atlanticum]|uniref:N(6)-L-threonylcarbamoyladenine synthase n=1 Tax=Papaver atlanticum TaxID=357466 RepID=A0AAD4T7X7_9MAGN|nr:hypothetical protein MKW98_011864 [Papaver atlanticum]
MVGGLALQSLSSTFSRLNFLLKPPLQCTSRIIRTQLKPQTQKPTSNLLKPCYFSSYPSNHKISKPPVRSDGKILSQVVSSQADLLEQFGGVSPKDAKEQHSKVIDQVVQRALDEANLTEVDLSAVAVTIGPGLSLCLRVGVQKARRIAGKFSLPIVGVHHMEAHALVARVAEKELQFPFLTLLISGGHNLLVLACDLGHYVQLGTTIDDAIGEAYDKTARLLGLDMRRGGPALEELAREGNPKSVKLKVPMKHHKD